MKPLIITFLTITFLGCTPKIGKDILIEPQKNIIIKSSKSDMARGLFSAFGIGNTNIKVATDVKVTNNSSSDITIKKLNYAIKQESRTIATGELKGAVLVASKTQNSISLPLDINTSQLSFGDLFGTNKKELTIDGDAIFEFWWMEHHKNFSEKLSIEKK